MTRLIPIGSWKNIGRYGLLVTLLVIGVFLLSNRRLPQKANLNRQLCVIANLTAAEVAQYQGISLARVDRLREQGMTLLQICALSEMALSGLEFERTPNEPFAAAVFRARQQEDEKGFIPPDGMQKGIEHLEMMQSAQGRAPDALAWNWIGPGNIGGRIRTMVISPTNPTTMIAGSVTGGLWRTINGGTTWQPVNDFLATLAVSSLVMDPTNGNVLYAGTGESFIVHGGMSPYARGAGVFKSTDGGTTWTQLASTTGSANWNYVNRLAISPNGNTLLAATEVGLYRSTDGGASWTLVPINGWPIADVDFHPVDSSKAVAGGKFGDAYYSTDGGASWNAANFAAAAGRIEIAYAPSSPNIVYASMDNNNGEIWRSVDGGVNYVNTNTGNAFLATQGFYDNALWVDPINANIVIVGGIDLYRSVDGGSTLTKISRWQGAPNSAHADQHFMMAHPGFDGNTNKIVYFANDGGLYQTNDVYNVDEFNGWQELNNNLGITQFYGAAGNVTSGVIVGGTQDNGTLRYDPNAANPTESWTTMYGGDGGFNAADQNDPNTFYGEYVRLQIHRSDDAGLSSDPINGYFFQPGVGWVWKNPPYRIEDAFNNAANFIAPFILDPNASNRLLGGGASLWRTNDAKTDNTDTTGPTWEAIKDPTGSNISAIDVPVGNSDVIWVGHNDGGVYKTADGTAAPPNWTRVDNNGTGLPDRFVMRVTIYPTDTNTVYVTFGGFSADNVYRTTDGGNTWTDISGAGATGLPDVPVRDLVIHPDNPNYLYVATEVGVFASTVGGTTWVADTPANVTTDELFWMGQTLVAATHGRGLYTADATIGGCVGPTAASNLATARNGGTVTLNWTAGAGATSYDVYRTANNPYFTPPAGNLLQNTAATTYVDNNMAIGSTANNYSYAIVAKNACGTTVATKRLGEFDFSIAPGGTGPAVYKDVPAGGIALSNTTNSCGGNEIVRNIYVSANLNVTDLNVGFNATHAYRGDIRVTLEAPDGTLATLVADVFDDNLNYDILLDDDAGGALDNDVDDTVAAPFYDRRVQQALLNTSFAGKAAQGTWILRICDNLGGDDGTYHRSELQIR